MVLYYCQIHCGEEERGEKNPFMSSRGKSAASSEDANTSKGALSYHLRGIHACALKRTRHQPDKLQIITNTPSGTSQSITSGH